MLSIKLSCACDLRKSGLDTGQYPTGTSYTAADVDALPLRRHDFHGDWNYTLLPTDTP